MTEQIKQHLARLEKSGPGKKVLRARRTGGPKMAKIQKSQKSNRLVQNVGKVKYMRKTRLEIQIHHILGQDHNVLLFLGILDPKSAIYGALFGPIGPYLPGLGK